MGIADRDYMRDRHSQRVGRTQGPVIEPGPRSLLDRRWIIVLTVIIAALACFAIFRGDNSFGAGGFPANGAFRVHPDFASGETATLTLTTGENNTVVQLLNPAKQPVFIGFVRARSTAQLPVPTGRWNMVVTETDEWDGSFNIDPAHGTASKSEIINVQPQAVIAVQLRSPTTETLLPSPDDVNFNLGE